MVRKLTAAAAALATLTASCAPPTQAPMKVRALVLSSNGEYAPTEVELKTITNIVAMEGQVLKLTGGAHIRLDSQDPEANAAQTDEAYLRAVLKDAGRPVTASYITDETGVLWPADFHTWNLVTTYYNLERAWDYFINIAEVKQAELPQATAYYFPEFVLADTSDEPLMDNALFFSPVQAFLVLPFKEIQKAPLALNASILTHEYAHLVFNRRVYEGRGVPDPIRYWGAEAGATPGLNILKSLDEGLADFHAYVASCQTSFGCNTRVLATSYEDPSVEARDLSKNWCMSPELNQQLYTANYSALGGREYQVGTIIASALYKASASAADRQVLARAVAAAYSDSEPTKYGLAQLARTYLSNQSGFTMARALRSIVQHIPSGNVELKNRVCSNLATRLRIPVAELSGGVDAGPDDCPESTTINNCSTTP